MAKVIDSMDSLMFSQNIKVKGNRWHIHKEFWHEDPITYCDLTLNFYHYRMMTTNDSSYEWQFGKKWQPENICPKCVKNFELVVA